MRILIVDDDNDKIGKIVSLLRSEILNLDVDVSSNIFSAKGKLVENKYNLLILDLNIPVREGEPPSETGGFTLAKLIEQESDIKIPNHVVGLTQFDKLSNNFPSIWKVIIFNPTSGEWENALLSLIKLIAREEAQNSYTFKKETVFLEGLTDLSLFSEAVNLFRPELLDRINFEAENNAGADWVCRKIIIWAKSLNKRNDSYIKAIGILDGDNAGIKAKSEINRVIPCNSAEARTFSTITLAAQYAKGTIPLLQKGLKIPIYIEDMFCPQILLHAQEHNWLENKSFVELPSGWNKYKTSLDEYINGLGLAETESVYLNKVKFTKKEKLCKYICNLNDDDKRTVLANFQFLIDSISSELFN